MRNLKMFCLKYKFLNIQKTDHNLPSVEHILPRSPSHFSFLYTLCSVDPFKGVLYQRSIIIYLVCQVIFSFLYTLCPVDPFTCEINRCFDPKGFFTIFLQSTIRKLFVYSQRFLCTFTHTDNILRYV